MGALIAADAVEISTGVGVVTIVIAAVAAAAIAVMWRATRPTPVRAGSQGLDLGDERPAIVDLLTGGFDVDTDAMPATVIDLANRGYFTIEKTGARTVLRLREHVNDRHERTAYDDRVLAHIRRNAVDGVTPAEVLTLGDQGVSRRWFRSFAREVTAHGRSLGLCRPRWSLGKLAIVWGLVAVAFAAPAIVGMSAPRTASPTGWASVGNVLAGVAFVTAFAVAWLARNATMGGAQVDTPAGRDAASHWLGVREFYRNNDNFGDKDAASVAIWDDHLAYATAMGLAPQVERQLPFEAEHDRHAWSNVSGEWRKVRVSYWSPIPFWGEHPGRVLFGGLVQGAFAGLVAYGAFQLASTDPSEFLGGYELADDRLAWLSLGATIVAIIGVALLLYCLAKVVIGALDLFRRDTVEGLVVRQRDWADGVARYAERIEGRFDLPFKIRFGASSNDDYRPRRSSQYVAIDDGTRDHIRAHRLGSGRYPLVAQGSIVRAKVSPITGYVADIEVLAAPAGGPANDSTVQHELVADMVGAAQGKLRDGLANLEQAIASDQAQHVLDQRDDDGITLRERLAESTAQLEQLRRDPNIRNSPLAGFLDALDDPRSDQS